MSTPIRKDLIEVDGEDFLVVHTDEQTAFIYPLTWEGPVPTLGRSVHPMSPVRRKVAAVWKAKNLVAEQPPVR